MSGSKYAILERIRQRKPTLVDLPDTRDLQSHIQDAESVFKSTLELIGADWAYLAELQNPVEWLENRYGKESRIVCLDSDFGPGNLEVSQDTPLEVLNAIEVAVIPGKLGVAENGGVWLDDSMLPHRILPFIAQHLVLTLYTAQLVPDLHEAYRRISVAETGFGVFIAGPSKTADIEQSLVKGAQGPRTTVVVLKDAIP